ncbi:MAG: helix-hairpin-helix domain-containing protein [Candidatus Deferrimicrobiaceae bacterium]
MKNQQISNVFNEIASLLELKGDNPFRIRSYQRAAQNIGGHTQDMAGMADDALRSGRNPVVTSPARAR